MSAANKTMNGWKPDLGEATFERMMTRISLALLRAGAELRVNNLCRETDIRYTMPYNPNACPKYCS